MKSSTIHRIVIACVLLSLIPLCAVSSNADDRRNAVTDIASVDDDYHDQGEYFGSVQFGGDTRTVGLQVVARGAGKFDALIYCGGLPGNGFDGSTPRKLSGERVGERIALRGESLVVYLQTGFAAVVKNLADERLGFLQPIKRLSPTLGLKPPPDAIVLFDGENVDRLKGAKITKDGLLEVGAETREAFRHFTLHAEFRTPYMPSARGQDRGNSGFYLQKRYEVQVLDSFGLLPQNNDCGSLYKFKAPDLNMSFPPLRWQTYDIEFDEPRFAPNGQRICKARISVRHNGVLIHNQLELENKTGGGSQEGPSPLPILFQDHQNPVNYRNIWITEHPQPNDTIPDASSASRSYYDLSTCPEPRRRHLFRRRGGF